jgi:hypothetical protein
MLHLGAQGRRMHHAADGTVEPIDLSHFGTRLRQLIGRGVPDEVFLVSELLVASREPALAFLRYTINTKRNIPDHWREMTQYMTESEEYKIHGHGDLDVSAFRNAYLLSMPRYTSDFERAALIVDYSYAAEQFLRMHSSAALAYQEERAEAARRAGIRSEHRCTYTYSPSSHYEGSHLPNTLHVRKLMRSKLFRSAVWVDRLEEDNHEAPFLMDYNHLRADLYPYDEVTGRL